MPEKIPTILGDTLTWCEDSREHSLQIGTAAWFSWLEQASSFAYRSADGSFTARKEQRNRGGWYWKAYRKRAGKLYRIYLGKAEELTSARLAETVAALDALASQAPPAPVASAPPAPSEPSISFMSVLRPRVQLLGPGEDEQLRLLDAPAGWPSGTITFVFTDIVNSTYLWERCPQQMPQVLVRHDALIRAAVRAHAGVIFKTMGDTICAAFARAPDALAAAHAAQQGLLAEDWELRISADVGSAPPMLVRMALHSGAATIYNGDYVGPPLNRAARLLALSHGGQILLSHATYALVGDMLPEGVSLQNLGTYQLSGMHGTGKSQPEQVFQLVSPHLPREFPPLDTPLPAAQPVPSMHPLLATKLSPPPLRAELIARPRLLARLRQITSHQLTLIVAPPGFGKTTLLTSWLAEVARGGADLRQPGGPAASPLSFTPLRVAWLTLDEADNDPARFWSYVAAALEQQIPGCSTGAAALLNNSVSLAINTIITLLVNAIAAASGILVLVLDDYHHISSADIHQALAMLIGYMPPNLHLVIASRSDLPLPLARLRARGQVSEIRSADLRCAPEEAAQFLRSMLGHDLSSAAINALLERTEGWMAGLQLAALSLQGAANTEQQIAAIRGENRYIWDYLIDEVLNQQTPDLRRFLLQTSPLDRLCAELCDEVLERDTPLAGSYSRAILDELERTNLFTVALDSERHWYRYHRLFADVLRLRLCQLYPDLTAPIHRRAAAWYRRHGLLSDSIRHMLAIHDWDTAAAYIEECIEAMLMRGEVVTLNSWLGQLPVATVASRPRLELYYTAILAIMGRLEDVAEYLARVEAHNAQWQLCPETPIDGVALAAGTQLLVAGELETIKSILSGARGDMSTAVAYARTALERLPAERTLWRLVASMMLSTDTYLRGNLTDAMQLIERQLELSRSSDNHLLHMWAQMLLGYAQIQAGKLRQAAQTCWHILAPVDDRSDELLPISGAASAWLSQTAYEWNDLDAAERFAQEGIAQGRRIAIPEQIAFNLSALAVVLQLRGDSDGATVAFDEAMRLVQPLLVERDVMEMYRARWWLLRGELTRVIEWAEARKAPTHNFAFFAYTGENLLLAWALLAESGGHAARARAILNVELEMAEKYERLGQVLQACALLAWASAALGDLPQALRYLERALQLTEPEGYIRTFVDMGAPMAGLLRQLIARGHLAPQMLAYCQRILAAFDAMAPGQAPGLAPGQAPALPESLSARELQVLHLVSDGQSNQRIAQTLVVAESTVKMHLKNIYGKLGTHSRTQALARARDLGLLEG